MPSSCVPQEVSWTQDNFQTHSALVWGPDFWDLGSPRTSSAVWWSRMRAHIGPASYTNTYLFSRRWGRTQDLRRPCRVPSYPMLYFCAHLHKFRWYTSFSILLINTSSMNLYLCHSVSLSLTYVSLLLCSIKSTFLYCTFSLFCLSPGVSGLWSYFLCPEVCFPGGRIKDHKLRKVPYSNDYRSKYCLQGW